MPIIARKQFAIIFSYRLLNKMISYCDYYSYMVLSTLFSEWPTFTHMTLNLKIPISTSCDIKFVTIYIFKLKCYMLYKNDKEPNQDKTILFLYSTIVCECWDLFFII